jgi:hypothetical protein
MVLLLLAVVLGGASVPEGPARGRTVPAEGALPAPLPIPCPWLPVQSEQPQVAPGWHWTVLGHLQYHDDRERVLAWFDPQTGEFRKALQPGWPWDVRLGEPEEPPWPHEP